MSQMEKKNAIIESLGTHCIGNDQFTMAVPKSIFISEESVGVLVSLLFRHSFSKIINLIIYREASGSDRPSVRPPPGFVKATLCTIQVQKDLSLQSPRSLSMKSVVVSRGWVLEVDHAFNFHVFLLNSIL